MLTKQVASMLRIWISIMIVSGCPLWSSAFMFILASAGPLEAEEGVISLNFIRTDRESMDAVDTEAFISGAASDLTWSETGALNGSTNITLIATNLDGSSLDLSITAPLTLANIKWPGWPHSAGFGSGDGIPAVFVLSDIPYAQYYILAYVGGYDPARGAISDGTTTYYYDFGQVSSGTVLVLSGDTDKSDGYDAGNYVQFGSANQPLTASQVTLTLARSFSKVFLGGIQIVEVSPVVPSWPSGVNIRAVFTNSEVAVNAASFGFSANASGAVNKAALDDAVAYCQMYNVGVLNIDQGEYEVGDYADGVQSRYGGDGAVCLTEVTNLIVDGHGALLKMNAFDNFIGITGCDNVVIRDLKMTFNSENQSIYSVFEVNAVDAATDKVSLKLLGKSGSGDIKTFNVGYLVEGEDNTYSFSTEFEDIFRWWKYQSTFTRSGDIYSFTLLPEHTGYLNAEPYHIGDKYVMRSYQQAASGIDIRASENITITNVTLNQVPGNGVTVRQSDRICVSGCRIERPDGSTLPTVRNGLVFMNGEGHLSFKGNTFAWGVDDGINIRSDYTFVESAEGNQVVLTGFDWRHPWIAGDRVSFYSARFNPLGAPLQIGSINEVSRTLFFNATLPDGLSPGCAVFNQDLPSGNYIIDDNKFLFNRGHAVVTHTPYGLIQNNTCVSNYQCAIKAMVENGQYVEGTSPCEIRIKNNTVLDCNYAGVEDPFAIQVEVLDSEGNPSPLYPLCRNIHIIGNTIKSAGGSILISSAKNVLVWGNAVSGAVPFGYDGLIQVQYSENVQVQNNNPTIY